MPNWLKNALESQQSSALSYLKPLSTPATDVFPITKIVTPMAVQTSPTTGKRVVRLIMITFNKNYKYYEMQENPGDTFTVKYGRVGFPGVEVTYPIQLWDRKLYEKLRKGYIDMTHLFANNQYIVYNEQQCTIRYLIEVKTH